MRPKRVEPCAAVLVRLATAIEPKNQRVSLESTEHQTDSAVLAQMSMRFDPAAAQIDIGHTARVEAGKTRITLGRKVDMSIGRQGRRCNEEHLLRIDKGGFFRSNFIKHFQQLALNPGTVSRLRESVKVRSLTSEGFGAFRRCS